MVVVVVERFGAEHGAGLLVVCMRVVMDGRMESGGAVGRHRSGGVVGRRRRRSAVRVRAGAIGAAGALLLTSAGLVRSQWRRRQTTVGRRGGQGGSGTGGRGGG